MSEPNSRPDVRSPSRRSLLCVAAACVGVAGCAGTESTEPGRDRVCEASVLGGDSGTGPIERVDVRPGDTVVLEVVLSRDAKGFARLDRILVFDSTDTLLYTVPRASAEGPDGPRLTYQQALGPFPQNGELRVEARSADGATLGSTAVEFNCYVETPPAE